MLMAYEEPLQPTDPFVEDVFNVIRDKTKPRTGSPVRTREIREALEQHYGRSLTTFRVNAACEVLKDNLAVHKDSSNDSGMWRVADPAISAHRERKQNGTMTEDADIAPMTGLHQWEGKSDLEPLPVVQAPIAPVEPQPQRSMKDNILQALRDGASEEAPLTATDLAALLPQYTLENITPGLSTLRNMEGVRRREVRPTTNGRRSFAYWIDEKATSVNNNVHHVEESASVKSEPVRKVVRGAVQTPDAHLLMLMKRGVYERVCSNSATPSDLEVVKYALGLADDSDG